MNKDSQELMAISSSHEIQRLLSRTVRLGFALVLTLTFILGLVGLYQIYSVNESMDQIVEINNNKTSLTYEMRDAIRLRALSMNKIRASDDVFVRDEELMRFYDYAGKYRSAREKLKSMRMDDIEDRSFNILTEHVRASQQLNRKAAELLVSIEDDKGTEEFERVLNAAQVEQQRLLDLLDDSVELQTTNTENAVVSAQKKFKFTIYIMIAVVVVLLTIGIFIARKVTKYVGKTNQLLNLKTDAILQASQDAEDATLAKSQFLANMSHEIRTPLTAIIGYSEMLMDPESATEELENSAIRINRSGIHLHQIINDVLDISKIEAGEIEVEKLVVSPLELADDVLEMVSECAAKKDVALSHQYHFSVPKNITTDPTRLKQILLNIVSNALKFTKQGSVMLEVSFLTSTKQIKYVVRDTGIGMNDDEVEVIFQPFAQANSSTTRKYGGTGLGLTISKQLANKLGGDVTCQSKEGQGTTFVITIDAGDVDSQSLNSEEPEKEKKRLVI